MSEAAKWYIIHTYSGYENKVKQDIEKVVENRKLHDLILEVQVPTETVTEITDGKTKELERKTFPGYVFLKMVYTDDTWRYRHHLRNRNGRILRRGTGHQSGGRHCGCHDLDVRP